MATGVNSSGWPRRAAAAALAAAFIVLAPVAVASAWIRSTVLSTSGYVAAVSDVPASPAVRTAIREAVTAEASAGRSPAGGVLAGPLRTGLADLAGKETSAFMASPAFERLWVAANQFAHAQLIGVLSGNSTLVRSTGEPVTLNLLPLARIPLFPAAALNRLQHAYRVLTTTTWLALTLTPLAFAGALAASRRRRRTLLCLMTGGAFTLLLALILASWLQSSLVVGAGARYRPVTSALLHALTSGFFTLGAWCVAGSLTLAAVALLSGPYRWAAAIRRYAFSFRRRGGISGRAVGGP